MDFFYIEQHFKIKNKIKVMHVTKKIKKEIALFLL